MQTRRCFTCGGTIPAGAPLENNFCSIHCEHYFGLAQATARHAALAHADDTGDSG